MVELVVQGGTDSQASSSAQERGSSMKWPLMGLLMQMTDAMKEFAVALRLRWRPREENQEADDLTNCNFSRFDLDLRVDCSLKDLRLDLFQELAASYEAYTLAKVELKAAGRKEGPTSKKQRMLEKTVW